MSSQWEKYYSIKQYLQASRALFFVTGNVFLMILNNFILENICFDYCKWSGVGSFFPSPIKIHHSPKANFRYMELDNKRLSKISTIQYWVIA